MVKKSKAKMDNLKQAKRLEGRPEGPVRPF